MGRGPHTQAVSWCRFTVDSGVGTEPGLGDVLSRVNGAPSSLRV